jgi:hypothetical protein
MNGLPQTVSALTTASTDDVLAVLYVEADKCNVGEIMRRMLARFTESALCVFDSASRRIIGTTDAATWQAIQTAWDSYQPGHTIVQPRAGQYGTLMLWEAVQDDLNIGGTLANDYQKRAFYGLVNAGLGLWGNTTPAQTEPCCLVDQANGIILFKFADLSGLANMTPSGQTVCVEFAGPKTKLIFE